MSCSDHILNLGAGVQFTAVYSPACEGKLATERAIFADTHDEPATVYTHLGGRSLGGPSILIRTAGWLGDGVTGAKGTDLKAGGAGLKRLTGVSG